MKMIWSLRRLEYAIIEFLSMNPGQVFDRERIYEKVCGYDAEGDSRVVTELIRRVRKKLAEYTQTEYIETVWGWGIDGKDKKFILEKDNGFIYDTQLDCHFFFFLCQLLRLPGRYRRRSGGSTWIRTSIIRQ